MLNLKTVNLVSLLNCMRRDTFTGLQCARFSSADCTFDIATDGLVWPHFSTSAPRGYRPLQLEENEVNTVI